MPLQTGEVVHSAAVEDDFGFQWRAAIYPLGNNDAAHGNVSVYLDVANAEVLPDGWRRYVEFQFEVVGGAPAEGHEAPWLSTEPLEHGFDLGSRDWGFAKGFKHSKLRRDLMIDRDRVTLHVFLRGRPEMPMYQGKTARQWRNWLRKGEGQEWVEKKQREAIVVSDWLVRRYGLGQLSAGAGVVDIGGDPGFLAAELVTRGIPCTVVDPCFGVTGKGNQYTSILTQPEFTTARSEHGRPLLRTLKQHFDQSFTEDPANSGLLETCSVMVAMYPDEGTDFFMAFTAANAHRVAAAIIP